MPLSPATEFLSAQRDEFGNALCSVGYTYVQVVVPPLTAVQWTISLAEYMSYDFRLLIDDSVVPFAFDATVRQYGVDPYTGTITPSGTDKHIDYFLRVTPSQPLEVEIVNLTNLNQRWVSADQFLSVANEDNWIELEKRLARYFGQAATLPPGLVPI